MTQIFNAFSHNVRNSAINQQIAKSQHKPNVKLPRHHSYQISETYGHNFKSIILSKKTLIELNNQIEINRNVFVARMTRQQHSYGVHINWLTKQ